MDKMREAFEAWAWHTDKGIFTSAMPKDFDEHWGFYVEEEVQSHYKTFLAALEHVGGIQQQAGQLFGYGCSEKKNCLLSKAQFDNCAPKNRIAYDIPLYAYSLPKGDSCKGYGVITHISGMTPDNYEECNEVCRDCEGTGEAARQPAPALTDEQIFAIHASTNDADSQILAFARAILSATNQR